jgi:hypothetical protein
MGDHGTDTHPATEAFGIRDWPGYRGAFTRNQVEGAMPNGTRIRKCHSEPGDSTPDGAEGTVLGSMSHPEIFDGIIVYFVEWDWAPRHAVGTLYRKIEKVE